MRTVSLCRTKAPSTDVEGHNLAAGWSYCAAPTLTVSVLTPRSSFKFLAIAKAADVAVLFPANWVGLDHLTEFSPFDLPGQRSPIERHELVLDRPDEALEPLYFNLLDDLQQQGWRVTKLIDTAAATGRFGSEAARRTLTSQESATASVASDPPPSASGDHYRPLTLETRIRQEGRLPATECVRIAVTLADALRHLHEKGLVHRDIKPSNIIFVGGVPKLADVSLVAQAVMRHDRPPHSRVRHSARPDDRDEAKTLRSGSPGSPGGTAPSLRWPLGRFRDVGEANKTPRLRQDLSQARWVSQK